MNSSSRQLSGHNRESISNWDPDVRLFRRYFVWLLSPPPSNLAKLSVGRSLTLQREKTEICSTVFLFFFLLLCWWAFLMGTSVICLLSGSCKHIQLNNIFHVAKKSSFKSFDCTTVLLFLLYCCTALMQWSHSRIIMMIYHKPLSLYVFLHKSISLCLLIVVFPICWWLKVL